MRKKIFFMIVLLFFQMPVNGHAQSSLDLSGIRAAFIRDGNLWVIDNHQTEQITTKGKVYGPEWSYDGKWVLYQQKATSDFSSQGTQNEIWAYNPETKKKEKIFYDGYCPQWAPDKDLIAFQSDSILDISNIKHFYNVAMGVHGFTWMPDGKGFLVASHANLLPEGWTNPILYTKNLPSHLNDLHLYQGVHRFYTIPKKIGVGSTKILSINAEGFHYSPSHQWLSFVVSPTASWSMDSNMLCVISNKGKDFEVLDEIILGVGKPKWAPTKDIIAYIAGGGRIVAGFKNKKLKAKEMPVLGSFTPKGFADLDFTWTSNETIVTSRVKETEWSNDPDKHPLPTLYSININSGKETMIVTHPKNYGDYDPKYLNQINKLIWLRGRSIFDKKRTLWMSNPDGSKAHEWLKNIEEIEVYQN